MFAFLVNYVSVCLEFTCAVSGTSPERPQAAALVRAVPWPDGVKGDLNWALISFAYVRNFQYLLFRFVFCCHLIVVTFVLLVAAKWLERPVLCTSQVSDWPGRWPQIPGVKLYYTILRLRFAQYADIRHAFKFVYLLTVPFYYSPALVQARSIC